MKDRKRKKREGGIKRGREGGKERGREKLLNCQRWAKPDCQVLFWGLFQITVTYRLRLELSLILGLQPRSWDESWKGPT